MDYDLAKSILGLRSVGTEEEVNLAFRDKSKTMHPDAGGNQKDFIRLCDARALLLRAVRIPVTGDTISETRFCKLLTTELERFGALCFKVHGHAMQKSGWPDLQVYSKEWTGHLELKVGTNPASAIQKEVIRKLRLRGANAYVLRLRGKSLSIDGTTWKERWPVNGGMLLGSLQGNWQ